MNRVVLTSKEARGNHRHKFRPTGDARLRSGEQGLATALRGVLAPYPPGFIEDAVREQMGGVEFIERLISNIDASRLEEAIYNIYIGEQEDSTARLRAEVNADMRRLGSPVRLKPPGSTSKAKTVDLEWGATAEATSDKLPSFDQAPSNAKALAYARTESRAILANLAATEQAVIADQIAAGFTTVQEFSTGRVVTGRTTGQTASAIFDILRDTTRMVLTAEDAAIYRSGFTNGLFPRWATAVNRFADRAAEDLAERGITGAKAKTILDKRTMKYGDKLRRTRARNIARTETNRVQNAAMQEVLEDARSRGLVGSNAMKEWVTGPYDVCPICQGLGGQRVLIHESFSVGDTPPAHPSCRCMIRLVPNLETAPRRFGTGTGDDPFRYQFNDGFVVPVTPVV